MSGRKETDDASVDDYEFYLADDVQELELDFAEDTPAPAAPRATKRPSLADRAPKGLAQRARKPKKMTALEALAELEREAEAKRAAAAAEIERKKKAELARQLALQAAERIEQQRIEEEERSAAEEAEWARAAFGSAKGPGVPVAGASQGIETLDDTVDDEPVDLPDGAVILNTYRHIPAAVVGPLMASHKARAQTEGDLPSAIAFARVQAAVDNALSRPMAHRVHFGGTDWAVWLADDEVIGVFSPADLYLVGLS